MSAQLSHIGTLKLELFRRLSSEELKRSLLPAEKGSLKARPDGTLLDGHHRLTVLIARGEDVNKLPREIIGREQP